MPVEKVETLVIGAAQPSIFVINMAKDKDRMGAMAQQLVALKLPFERIEAVVGAELTADEKQKHYSDFWFRFLMGRSAIVGEIGCYLSHKKAWRTIQDRKLDWAIVLEDDVSLPEGFGETLQAIEANTREFDMVHLFSKHQPNKFIKRTPHFNIMRFKDFHHSGASYALRPSGIAKLLTLQKIIVPVDIWPWLSVVTGLRCCGILPFPVSLNPKQHTLSTIIEKPVSPYGKRGKMWKIGLRYPLSLLRLTILLVRNL
jgi:glycosyl transferase, family 25